MSKKIYIGEDNLINIKNAMAGKNTSHSTFMPEDKPPYEKDEYEIGGEGGNNDFFHVNENAYQELINIAIKFRPNKFKKWAVIIPSKPGIMPNYFEKKSRAIEFKKWYGEGVIVDLDKYNNLNESYRFSKKIGSKKILTESQESKSIAAAKKLVMQRLGYNEQEADEFVRIKLRNDIPSLRTPQGGKFILGVTRMFCNGELRNANDIGNLNSTLKLVASDAHINEYDRNLNNLSCQELIQRFAKAMSDNLDAEKDEINQMVFDAPSDYEIVRIDSFEQAEKYGDYVSWCVTHDEDMFDSYTSDGINQFYFCLKYGFESVDEQPGDGCPLDEYGLSMIAVSVNENGMLNTCTCRWNHDNGGDDSIMDAKQVSQVIGMNFFEVFKPNNKWNEILANVKQRLANGEEPTYVFDYVGDFSEGFAVVGLNGKYNFVNQEGELLSDQWFGSAHDFRDGFATVLLNRKCNFINQEGRLLSDQWFDSVYDFNNGFAVVELNEKYNVINQEGKIISSQWFDNASNFVNGFAVAELNHKFNFINQEGRLISNQWFDSIHDFSEGFARVKLNGKYNFVNQEGELLSNQWFDIAYDFKNGFAIVKLNEKYNFISREGRIISDQWFDYADYFSEGFAWVKLNRKCNFINKEGRLLSDQWFDIAYDFKNGFAIVKLNGKYNFVNQEGELLSDQWFDYADYFREGFADVKLNGKNYRLDTNGNLTIDESKKYKKIIMPENKLVTIKENLESEVEANQVNLDSFKKQKELAPKIWDGDKLNSRVRLKLLDIADDFWETTDIGWVKPKGIVLMGSICNYNWSKSSDIDLHLQVDFSEVDEKKDFVQEYFNGKKNEWNEEHSNLKIFGFPVEVYVEDIDADTNSGGIYDLEENDWIKKPSKDGIKPIGLNKYSIKDKSAEIMTDIDDLYDLFKKTDDDAKLRKIGEKARHILDYVKAMRKNGLSRGGESDKDNIVYKVLRRTGYMDTLWNLSSQLYDKLNSIDEVTEGQAELILEYLEDKHNFPLYQYFKWAKSATDKDKAIDLLRQCGDVAIKYLETRNANQCDELRDLRIRLKRDGEDVQYENDFIEEFGNGIANNGLMRDFEFFMRYRGDFYELPSWMTMDFNRIVKNEWCIHFCYDADSIAREGFKWGTDDMGKLALTGAGMEKPSEGYNFAFPIGEYHIDNNSYGSFNPSTRQRGSQEAVIFQTSGVEVYHEGDEQNQVVFWGPNAKNFIPIKYDREQGGWCIYGNKGQVLYTGKPSKILEWVLTNLPQYRKQIMVGKNGVNLKENTDLFTLAKERFGTTYDIRECGYILPDGSMLDFSGKHMITGNTDTSHLRGRRSIDHRDIIDLKWDADMSTETGINTNMEEFIRSGAIRIHCSNTWSSINLFNKPTKEQINVLLRLIQYSKGNVTVEIGDGNESYSYAEYDEAKPRKVISDIVKYFDEGINLIGNVTENKVLKEYFNKYCCLNEEVVADGNASHNPFKQRWKYERETLINYLVNYGELMTSKENGKQYKVLFDEMLSNRIGFNYCLCIQWNPLTMEPGNVIYVRAYDKFTKKIFRPQFDYRGRDNLEGTLDDVV